VKILIVALSFFSLIGCGTLEIYVDPRLQEYVTEFEDRYGLFNTTNIYIEELTGEYEIYAGLCIKNQGQNEIIIDETFYYRWANEYYAIQQVVVHELGHCELYLLHNDELFPNGMPKSIMYKGAFGYMTYYKENNEYYLRELGNY